MAHPSFELFRNEWSALAHSGASRAAAAAVAAAEPCIAALGCADLGELVELSQRQGRLVDRVTVDRAIGAMVASQGTDPLVAVAVVVTLIPGLKDLARRMEWGAGGPWGHAEEFSGDLMTTAWEVVTEWAGRRREFMLNALLHAVRMRLGRRAEMWRKEMAGRAHGADIPDGDSTSLTAAEQLARLLDDAAGRLAPRSEIAVVYAHRVLGLSLVELSAMTGLSRQSLDRSRARCEARLCA